MRLRPTISVLTTAALLVGSALLGVAAAPTASAATPSYQVTFVARVCPTYGDIMANRARNNIQESLRDLGKDTVYTSGQPISPALEATNDPSCDPLDDWQFALGTGYTGKTPATQYLSTVTNPYAQTIKVLPSTPELDAKGQDTGRVLQDAVTVTLTAQQAQLAQQSNRLWTQGGTKTDPLLQSVFGNDYGFGALRCAIDNLNGDNVEWIGYPAGSTHVFCYYYAVKPPPSAGTIVVRKQLEAGSNGPADFRYVGNISYTTTNDFTLTPRDDATPASASFVRAAGDAWDFEEQPTVGYDFVSLACSQTTAPVTGPVSTWVITGQKAVVHVGDGATVTCTYVNRDTPKTTGDLSISKVTYGGVGTFPVRITDPLSATTNLTATTTEDGVPDLVGATTAGATGTWAVRETLPAPTPLGRWDATSVQCNGAAVPFSTSSAGGGATFVTASRTINAGETVDCLLGNTFTPGGELQLAKTSEDGAGTFVFPVVRADQFTGDSVPGDAFTIYEATTAAAGDTAVGTALAGRQDLVDLPVDAGDASTYYVSELSPDQTASATWLPTAVSCRNISNGAVVPITVYPQQRLIKVTLTSAHPQVRCTATNTLTPVATLAVSKQIEGAKAGLQDAVRIAVLCTDGTAGELALPAGARGTTTMQTPLVVRTPGTCTVTETATGDNASAPLTETTHAVNGGAATSGTAVSVTVASGSTNTAAFIDVYGGLAPSGASPATPAYALLGVVLILLGTVAYAAGRAH